MVRLYYHKTQGGAEYLTDSYTEGPGGSREGTFEGARFIVRIYGGPNKPLANKYPELLLRGTEAAAPELLAALKEIITAKNEGGDLLGLIDMAESVVAKAEGRCNG